jgi:hypothetical protein
MCKLSIIVGILILLTMPAIAQIDSLRFTQIAVISSSEHVNNCLVVDFWNDNLPELVISGTNHVFVYNGQNHNLIWTSPTLSNYYTQGWQLELKDMNNDGYPDLAISDTSNLYIYNIVQNQNICNLPIMHFKSFFGLGDRNSDGFADIIVAKRGPTDGDSNPDSAWFEAYDGPNFNLSLRHGFLVDSYHHNGTPDYMNLEEDPGPIVIADLSGNQGLQRKIIIFTHYAKSASWWDGVYFTQIQGEAGGIKIVNPVTLAGLITIPNVGKMTSYSVRQVQQNQYLYEIANSWTYTEQTPLCFSYYNSNDYIRRISASGEIISTRIAEYNSGDTLSRYTPPIIGEIDPDNPGDELCYGSGNTLHLLSYPDYAPIWSTSVDSIGKGGVTLFHSSAFFNSPQILSSAGYLSYASNTFSGSTGNRTAVFPYGGLLPSLVADLNNDNQDEILCFRSSENYLFIYQIRNAVVGINNDTNALPGQFCLHANYPNPFNAQTIISYDLPREADVMIEIYDLLGRKVATLAEGMQGAGSHQAIWDGSSVSSGIYFYRLKVGEYTDIKKMTLLK